MNKTIPSGAPTRYAAPNAEVLSFQATSLFLELSGGTEPIGQDDTVYEW
jgi:hypothetical protein